MAASSTPVDPSRRISWVNRVLAPLALIAVLVAVVLIVQANTDDGGDAGQTNAKTKAEKKRGDGDGAENPRTYVVQEGDTLSGVAAQFDVSVKRLERLNPDIDPQTLNAGQELTIR